MAVQHLNLAMVSLQEGKHCLKAFLKKCSNHNATLILAIVAEMCPLSSSRPLPQQQRYPSTLLLYLLLLYPAVPVVPCCCNAFVGIALHTVPRLSYDNS
jgi:hypothetical protein